MSYYNFYLLLSLTINNSPLTINLLKRSMKSLINSIPFIILLTALVSCQKKASAPETGHFDLSQNWSSVEKLNLSEIAGSIEYVALESGPECMLGTEAGLQVNVLRDYLVIHDHNNVMRVFDRSGKYLNDVGKIGEGPEEYFQLNKYYIDEERKEIYILSLESKCLVYGFDGKFIRQFKAGGQSTRVIVNEEGEVGLLYLSMTADMQDTARLAWFDSQGKELSCVPLYQNTTMGGGWYTDSNVELYYYEGSLRFGEIPFDTLYQLEETGSFEPAWSFDPGPKGVTNEVLHNRVRFITESNNYTVVYFLRETERYFFLTGGYNTNMYKFLCDKKTGLARTADMRELAPYPYESGLVNDIDGGLPFWPKTTTSGIGVTCLPAIELMEHIKNQEGEDVSRYDQKKRQELEQLVGTLHEDDNPVVMIVSLK